MPGTEPLTRKRLKELLDYDPETGVFVWKYRLEMLANWNARYAGKEAGVVVIRDDGKREYLQISIAGNKYQAHRLAFLYMRGYWPNQIDHANGVGTDNRWKNLSNCTPAGNNRNQALRTRSTTGISGVHWNTTVEKYTVNIMKNGKRYSGGYFTGRAEAAKKAKELYKELGFHPNHGLTRKKRASK